MGAIGLVLILGAVVLAWLVVVRHVNRRRIIRARIIPPERAAAARKAAPRLDVLTLVGAPLARLAPSGYAARMQARIAKAAMSERWTVDRVVGAKAVATVVFALFGWMQVQANPSLLNVVVLVGGTLVGFFGPDALLNTRGDARSERIRHDLADAIDQLAVTVRAGLGLNAALDRLGRSLRGDLGDEISRVNQDIRLGMSRTEALGEMASRVDLPELTAFVRALSQAGDLGLPVASTLRVQADDMRLRRRQLAEEKAVALPVKLMFPTVLCILPALMIIVIGPAVVSAVKGLSGL